MPSRGVAAGSSGGDVSAGAGATGPAAGGLTSPSRGNWLTTKAAASRGRAEDRDDEGERTDAHRIASGSPSVDRPRAARAGPMRAASRRGRPRGALPEPPLARGASSRSRSARASRRAPARRAQSPAVRREDELRDLRGGAEPHRGAPVPGAARDEDLSGAAVLLVAVKPLHVREGRADEQVERRDLAAVGVAGELELDARADRVADGGDARLVGEEHERAVRIAPGERAAEVETVAVRRSRAPTEVVDAGEVERRARRRRSRPARCAARGSRAGRARRARAPTPE